eukprot:11531569-Alexandrium_andersonii.AAC.1
MLSCRPAVGCSVADSARQRWLRRHCASSHDPGRQPAARQQARWEEAPRTATTHFRPAGCRPTFTA